MNTNSWRLWLGVAVAAAIIAVPVQALERGLYLVDGTYYYVNDGGTRHVVQDYDTVKTTWFKDVPLVTTAKADVITALPEGDVITTTVGPDMVVKTTKVKTGSRLSRGVYSIDGTSDYYYIDGDTRYQVKNYDAVKSRWFADQPVQKTRLEVINALPAGDVITETDGPEVVVKRRKTTTTTTTTDDQGNTVKSVKTEESSSTH